MTRHLRTSRDLSPPPFSEGLDDWSRTDGRPDSPTYEGAANVRLVEQDAKFGACLELRKIETVQRLRYMGEVPIQPGRYLAIRARIRAVSGPLGLAQIAAWPGAAGGIPVTDLPTVGRLVPLKPDGAIIALRTVVGPVARPGVDLVWDSRVRYAHVGLDLSGQNQGVVRVESISVSDVTRIVAPDGPDLPGFGTLEPVLAD